MRIELVAVHERALDRRDKIQHKTVTRKPRVDIEQAIIDRAQDNRESSDQIIGRSPGLSIVDAREILAWHARGVLANEPADIPKLNFFKLASGAYVVSLTHSLAPPSTRQIRSQFFISSPGALARFANNPFSLLAWRAIEMRCQQSRRRTSVAAGLAG